MPKSAMTQMHESLADEFAFAKIESRRLIEVEKHQIIDAILYALDEDGHTGEWKIKFANEYYENTYKK